MHTVLQNWVGMSSGPDVNLSLSFLLAGLIFGGVTT